jgi:hypothetical protein
MRALFYTLSAFLKLEHGVFPAFGAQCRLPSELIQENEARVQPPAHKNCRNSPSGAVVCKSGITSKPYIERSPGSQCKPLLGFSGFG